MSKRTWIMKNLDVNIQSLLKRIFAIIIASASVFTTYSQSMEWLSRPGEYTQIQYLGNDLFKVRTPQGKWGLLHADGSMRIDASYDSISGFRENRALLLDRSGKRLLGIVDSKGNLVKDFSKEYLSVSRYPYFKEGRLVVVTKEELFGYVNDQGKFVIDPQFYFAAPFQNGVAAVQYKNTDYGLINKSGRSVIVSDEHYPFISSPVYGKVLVIRRSRKGGDQLTVMRIEGTSLKKDKVLEDGMNIWLSDDFTTIECQLGHTYHIDNQWRVSSSSHNAQLPEIEKELPVIIAENSTVLSKADGEGGKKITYLGNPILDYPFQDVSTYDRSYAVVRSKEGKTGVLKLNPSATIGIKSNLSPVVFHHNEFKEVILEVELVDIEPTKIKWYRNDQGWLTHSKLDQEEGVWKLKMPYFKSSDTYDNELTETVDIAITYDGLDWVHRYVDVISSHSPGYEVTLTGSDTTGENGKAILNLQVKAIETNGNPKGSIYINGEKPIAMDNRTKMIPLNISLPEGTTKTFTYSVEIKEEGCPAYVTTVSKKISNPPRKRNEIKKEDNNKKDEKKKIIIQ